MKQECHSVKYYYVKSYVRHSGFESPVYIIKILFAKQSMTLGLKGRIIFDPIALATHCTCVVL